MKPAWWRTGPPIKHTQPIIKPTGAQWLRQLALAGLIALIWGGLFVLFSSATGATTLASIAQADDSTPIPSSPTAVPTIAPTNTSPAITNTPTAPAATSTRAAAPTTASSPTAPAATATQVATPTSAATPTTPVTPIEAPAATATAPAAERTSGGSRFSSAVLPIFKQVCAKCHGGDKEEEGLNLLSYAAVMRGSDNGPIVVPGDPGNSLLVQQVESGDMPKRGPKLLPKQIKAIVDWVAAGAPNN